MFRSCLPSLLLAPFLPLGSKASTHLACGLARDLTALPVFPAISDGRRCTAASFVPLAEASLQDASFHLRLFLTSPSLGWTSLSVSRFSSFYCFYPNIVFHFGTSLGPTLVVAFSAARCSLIVFASSLTDTIMLQFRAAACRFLPAYLLQASPLHHSATGLLSNIHSAFLVRTTHSSPSIQFAAMSLVHTRHYHSGAPAWSCTAAERERLCCTAAPKKPSVQPLSSSWPNAAMLVRRMTATTPKNKRFLQTSRNQANSWPTIDNLCQDPLTKRLHLVFLELLQSVLCPVGVQDPSLVRCGVSCNVPTLFDFLLIALGMRQKCLVLSWQSQLCCSFPDCTSNSSEPTCMFFALTSNSVDISFGLFFFVSNSQWCPASVPREKLGNLHVKKNSHRGAWSMPGAQTTTFSDHDESTNRALVA